MLEACGEKGYRRVAVQDVIDRYGGNRVQFYRHFASKADCYATAYEHEVGRLVRADLRRLAGRAALAARAARRRSASSPASSTADPALARGLLVEVHVAGGPALRRRAEVCERFARADRRGARRAPVPSALAAADHGAVHGRRDRVGLPTRSRADRPQAFSAAVPELAHMVVATYLGEDAAREELAAATAA